MKYSVTTRDCKSFFDPYVSVHLSRDSSSVVVEFRRNYDGTSRGNRFLPIVAMRSSRHCLSQNQ